MYPVLELGVARALVSPNQLAGRSILCSTPTTPENADLPLHERLYIAGAVVGPDCPPRYRPLSYTGLGALGTSDPLRVCHLQLQAATSHPSPRPPAAIL